MSILDEGLHVIEAPNEFGIAREIKVEDNRLIVKETYDAEPLLEACAAERIATAGQRWGEMRKVGTMPMAEYIKLSKIRDNAERQKFIMAWLRENQKFVTFEKFLR